MRIVEPKVEIWKPKSYSIEDGLRHAERCGRVCYNSLDRITDDSWKKFISNIIKNKHHSVLEHSTVYLELPIGVSSRDADYHFKFYLMMFFKKNPYTYVASFKVNTINEPYKKWHSIAFDNGDIDYYFISTNYRVLIEESQKNFPIFTLKQLEPFIVDNLTMYHEPRITVHWTISRGIADEFMRHRALSHSCQSTRYVKIKDLEIVKPSWWDDYNNSDTQTSFKFSWKVAEDKYSWLIEQGLKPQQARDVLPLGLKTELIQTGFLYQWQEFFKLRCAKDAHPDAQYIANKLKDLFENEKLVKKTD